MSFYAAPFKAIAEDPSGEFMAPRISVRLRNGENRVPLSTPASDASWTRSYMTVAAGSTDPIQWATSIKMTRSNSAAVECFADSPVTATLREAQGRFIIGVWAVKYFNHLPAFRLALVDGSANEYYATFAWGAGGTTPTLTAKHATVGTPTVTAIANGYYRIALPIDATTAALHDRTWLCRTYPAYGTTSSSGIGLYQAHAGIEQQPTATESGTLTVTFGTAKVNQPGTLLALTDVERVVEMNPIRTEREWVTGSLVAQTWQVTLTNDEHTANNLDLGGAWIAVEGDFAEGGQRALLAQGRINSANMTPAGTVSIDVVDQMKEAFGQKFQRDFALTTTGWCGNVRTLKIGNSSSSYNNDYDNDNIDEGVLAVIPALFEDATFVITFTSATAFKVTHPDGTDETGFTVGADANVTYQHAGTVTMLTIKAAGWTGGTFATGDQFKFATSKALSGLNPLYVVFYLITTVMQLRPYDVVGGQWYLYGVDSTATWSAAFANYSSSTVGGVFEEGDEIISVIEKLLWSIHASVFTTPTGQLGLYELLPNVAAAYAMNGDIAPGLKVNLMEPPGIVESMDRLANAVTYRYLDLLGKEASIAVEDADSIDANGRVDIEVDLTPVRFDGPTIEAAASKMLNRRKNARRSYTLRAMMCGAVRDINEPLALSDSMAGIAGVKTELTAKEIDIMTQEVAMSCYVDETTLAAYGRVGDAYTSPAGGRVGDAGTTPVGCKVW